VYKKTGQPQPHEVSRIVAAVEALAQEPLPNGSEKLSGSEHTYRIRVGDYRVIYTVLTEFRIVEVQRARHRKDVYRR
jgi:mRNA interferase RelE/StbE